MITIMSLGPVVEQRSLEDYAEAAGLSKTRIDDVAECAA